MKTRTVPIEEAPASRGPARHIATKRDRWAPFCCIALAIAACAACAACDTAFDTLAVPPPPSANRAKSAIAAVDSMQTGLHVRAFDLGENGDAPMRFPATLPSTIELLLYDRTVAELGLTAGELPRSDDASALPVPDAREMFRASLNDDGLSAWSVETERSPALEELRVAIAGAGGPCAEWSLETITTTATGDTRFAVTVGEEITLVGTDVEYLRIDGASWRVLGPVPPTIEYRSGSTDDRGNVYFGTTGATIYRLKTIEPFAIELVGSSTPTAGSDSIQWIDGGVQDDGTLELYSLTLNGSFERWTSSGPTLLYTLPFVNSGFSGGVSMIDRGRAVAINPDDPEATR